MSQSVVTPVDGVLFVTGAREFPHLAAFVQRHHPDVRVFHAAEAQDLAPQLSLMPPRSRMIAVATSVIVPASILDGLLLTPYNFHPGSPEFPGRYPESFAAYEGVQSFAATAHVMFPRVDEGPIVGVERFDVVGSPDRMTLADLAYQAMITLFARLAPQMVLDDRDLPPLPGIMWSGTKRTLADYQRMRQITPDLDEMEKQRRHRAFGKQEES